MGFFTSRAAECAANIIAATLADCGPGIFTGVTPSPNGEVTADLTSGASLRLKWSVEGQCIQQLERIPAPGEMIEMVLAA